ncbi:uncharacterized protein LOC115536078 [Gadus morhua]|uniref:uncharacterized protein LOC115536078 n=1 Tax=Gadus morhua TaxID=8049 RepID=UPI0011B72A2A|nr:uncharacterized protein LOC115536078 [Gadus morhua]
MPERFTMVMTSGIDGHEGEQETLGGDSSSPPSEQRLGQGKEASPYPDSSSPSSDSSPPYPVSSSSDGEEHMRQMVNRWLEANEEGDDPILVAECELSAPNPGQTPPDPGQASPDPGQTSPDRGRTPMDPGQTPHEPGPQHQGEGSGPLGAWLPPRVWPPREDLAQAMGTMRVWARGLRNNRVEPAPRLDEEEEKPLGRPSRNPFLGQTAPAPGQTAPAPGQMPHEPADTPPRKDLSQVMGNMAWAERATNSPQNNREHEELVNKAEEEVEAKQEAEGKGIRHRFNKWLNLRLKGRLPSVAALFKCGAYVL